MVDRVINLVGRGLRGQGYGDFLRRKGLFGVLPTDSDEDAITKINAAAVSARDAAIAASNAYPSQADGEAATDEGDLFSYVEDGLVVLALRTPTGSEPLDRYFSAEKISVSAGSNRSVADKLATRLGPDVADYSGVSDWAKLQAALDANAGRRVVINWRVTPWQIGQKLTPSDNTHIEFQSGAQTIWTGANPQALTHIFDLSGTTGVRITVQGRGEATFSAPEPMPLLFIAGGYKVIDAKVVDCLGENISHVFTSAATSLQYADIQTPAFGGSDDDHDCSRKIRVIRGGSTFSERTGQNFGSCYLAFTFDAKVVGSEYVRTPHGVQGWGGDSNPSLNGAPDNERKCGDLTIVGVHCRDMSGAAVWASMARDMAVVNCRCDGAHDVAFDAEGCHGAQFRGCWAKDAANGNYAAFNLNRGILFENCISVVSDPATAQHFRLYNATQNPASNEDVTISGGTFDTLAGIGVITTASGPCKQFTVSGITGRNTIIAVVGNNGNGVTIKGNQLLLTREMPPGTAAVEIAGLSFDGATLASALVTENRVTTTVHQLAGSAPFRSQAGEFNAVTKFTIAGNTVRGDWPAELIRGDSTGDNSGIHPVWIVRDNDLEDSKGLGPGAIFITEDEGAGPPVVRRYGNTTAAGIMLEDA